MFELCSPNGSIGVKITSIDGNWPRLQVVFHEKNILNCKLGLNTNRTLLFNEFRLERTIENEINESYELPIGKLATYINHGTELSLHYISGNVIRIRAYDNGIAFRYELSESDDNLHVVDEATEFELIDADNAYAQELIPTYELPYLLRQWNEMVGQRFGMPVLFSYTAGPYLLLSEAQVLTLNGNYCSCHLIGSKERSFKIAFAPEDNGKAMPVTQPFVTPWRVITIVPDLNELVRSHLAYDVNKSPQSVPEWVKPARALWSWWAYENGAQLYTQSRAYIDYAAAMGFEAVTLDCGWDANWVPTLCTYARQKGVQLWLWTGMQRVDTPEKAEQLLPLWASWGVSGLKIDFFENDSQHTMSVYAMLAQLAEKCKLMINFHGSTKPMGEGRTWPHFMTAEGIMGLEHYKWSDLPNSQHNCTVPFTRNVSGPMDYTPLGFSNHNRNTTHAHQLALTTVFESGVTHYSLSLFELEAWIGTRYLRRTKAKYDDVQLLSGHIGDHVAMLRRKAEEFFIGVIVTQGRLMNLGLEFLPEGTFLAEIYEDDSKDQMLRVRKIRVTNQDNLQLKLLTNGGAAIYLAREEQYLPELPSDVFMDIDADSMLLTGASEYFKWPDGTHGLLLGTGAEISLSSSIPNQTLLKVFYSCAESCELEFSYGTQRIRTILPATASPWDKCSYYLPLSPTEEVNTLMIARINGGICAIEKVQLFKSELGSVKRYSAEVAQLRHGTELAKKRSGDWDAIANGSNSDILFNDVIADREGWHVLSITYCGGESRNISIEVNNKQRIDTYLHSTSGWFFPTWENAEDKEVLVYLLEGHNTIRLYNTTGKLSHIRGIQVFYDSITNDIKQSLGE